MGRCRNSSSVNTSRPLVSRRMNIARYIASSHSPNFSCIAGAGLRGRSDCAADAPTANSAEVPTPPVFVSCSPLPTPPSLLRWLSCAVVMVTWDLARAFSPRLDANSGSNTWDCRSAAAMVSAARWRATESLDSSSTVPTPSRVEWNAELPARTLAAVSVAWVCVDATLWSSANLTLWLLVRRLSARL